MLERRLLALVLLCSSLLTVGVARAAEPIKLHPKNSHYLLFRGKPTVLVTSAEHYGAVLNPDFDYVPYLDELESKGLNLTRTFAGTYAEVAGSFGIQKNTLAPLSGKFLAPWARSATPGYAGGGNKFDLSKFNDAFFARLKDFVTKAGERGIVVELSLFCALYDDNLWGISPMNAINNVNGVGNVIRSEVFTLNNGGLLAVQDAFVAKVASELKEFDNVYYELANEPYFGISDEFQAHVLATLTAAESGFPAKHAIARNFCNDKCDVGTPDAGISIFNFHYADPPDAVGINFAKNRVLGYDETGFVGTADLPYRRGAWAFLLAGGAIFNNLDYSFTPDEEDGSFAFTTSPGGGGATLRGQLKILKAFFDEFDFVHMAPMPGVLDVTPGGTTAYALVKAGAAYAIYLKDGVGGELKLELPAGSYRARWVDTKTGANAKVEMFDHAGGDRTLTSPAYSEDIALDLRTLAEIEAGAAPHPSGGAGGAAVDGGGSGGGGGLTAGAGGAASPGSSGAPGPSVGGIAASGAAGPSASNVSPAAADSGCGCRVPREQGPAQGAWAGLVAAFLLGARTRRRSGAERRRTRGGSG